MKQGTVLGPMRAMDVFCFIAPLAFLTHQVGAADFHVPSSAAGCTSSGAQNIYCTLSEAIVASNLSPESDRILLDAQAIYSLESVDHEMEGGNGLPAISGRLLIEGKNTIIQRAGASATEKFRLFRIDREGDLTLRNVKLRNGATARGFDGAAIWSTGKLTLEFCTLEANNSGDDGGAIRSDGVLKISDSMIRGNSAHWRGGVGGGLQSNTQFGSADTLVERTTFKDNEAWASGGGLWIMGTTLLVNSTISGNRAGERGGGLHNYGSLSLRNVTITDNQAVVSGGGLFSYGSTALSNSILLGNRSMGGKDCEGTLMSHGYNRIGKSFRCTLEGEFTEATFAESAEIQPLTEFDGVLAHAPVKGSGLIDGGNPASPGSTEWSCEKLDQRRRSRSIGRCDIGAIEHDGKN